MGIFDKLGKFVRPGKAQEDPKEKALYDLTRKEPENPNAHMKLAEIYQKKGEKQKATSEYLLAADIFAKNQFYTRAISIYKQLSKRDPYLDQVYLKMAEIYREKGFLAESLAQYRILAYYYEKLGKKDKALNILEIMDKVNLPKNSPGGELPPPSPQAPPQLPSQPPPHSEPIDTPPPPETEPEGSAEFFDLSKALTMAEPLETGASKEVQMSERIEGVEKIFEELKEISGPSSANPYFNYNMGAAYHELGFCDQAIEQFKIALEKGQKPFDTLSMLGFCYWEKGLWDEAQQSFKSALEIERIPQEKSISAKYILSLLYQEVGRAETALGLLQEIATADKSFLSTLDDPLCPADKPGEEPSS